MRFTKTVALCVVAIIFMIQTPVQANEADDTVAAPTIVFENGNELSIDLIDKNSEAGKTIIYTREFGEYTEPFSENVHEIVVVNNIVAYKNTNRAKGTYIPLDGYVISYTGDDANFINYINIGDEVTLIDLEIPSLPDKYFKLEDLTVPIDSINSPRDANYIVLYDSSYGESTQTNPWGMELTVIDGAISNIVDIKNENGELLNNNSPIPPNGVVISIHSGNPFYSVLRESVKLGDTVTVAVYNINPYSAGKVTFDAYNPMSIEDNPLAWDAEKAEPYDSFRGPDQIIIYDSGYGARTGTNPYGYEVAVGSHGKIIHMGGNDSQIPDGGFVISGHGAKAAWLQKYARIGSMVMLNKEKSEIRLVFTPDSYVDMAMFSIKAAQDSLYSARIKYLDIDYDSVQKVIDTAASKMELVSNFLNEGKYRELIKTIDEIQNTADHAYYMTFESPKVENRAVWHRPREKNLDEVKKQLDMLKDTNINTLYLETYWNGYSIYPTKNKIMEHNPIYGGFDVLQAYIQEAHARGIEVHAWVENFLVGQNVADKKPNWMAVSRQGDKYFTDSAGIKYYYLNPALPEVCDFLSELYEELVINYDDIDGIQFDYLRYPESGDYSNDFGYDKYTRRLFKNDFGTDPISLKVEDKLWQKWCDFRENIINTYAHRIFSEVKSLKPDIQISADVWPDYDNTIKDSFQNPKNWTTRDYLNVIIPMSYYLNEQPVVEDINKTQTFAKDHALINVGLATITQVDTKILLRQIAAARAAAANGVGIFESKSLFNGRYDNALKLGAFSHHAITTKDAEQSVNLILSDIVRKIDNIYLKNRGISYFEAQRYKKLIKNIKVDLGSKERPRKAILLKNNLEKLKNVIENDKSLNRYVAARITTDLATAINIVGEYISNLKFMDKL
ncbi:MAG: family 10 glycosylhydrolase [Thermoanaerobacteraceae bacterium]|nr:family 10 glycosylhydrolase [Thermoanaerobacteraceae bacterium]